MAEILVYVGADHTHADPVKDQRGSYKRGYPVVVRPDGHEWGAQERLPDFGILKLPLVPVAKVEEYALREPDIFDPLTIVRRRRWRLRLGTLPADLINKFQTEGVLIVKARPAYNGPFDILWADLKGSFRNQQTGLDETRDLT